MNPLRRPSQVTAEDQAVIGQYCQSVQRFCRSRTNSREDANDAVQDTFMRYLRRSERQLDNPEAWLIRVAGRACVDLHRRAISNASVPIEDDHGVEQLTLAVVDPEQIAVQRQLITQVLTKLPDRERIVLVRLYLEDCTYQEVATELHQSIPYTRVLAQRARDRARTFAKHMCREPRPRRSVVSRPLPKPTPNGGLSPC
jgi:RNA polymerase sigma factor (sigma-70 family)